MWPPVARRLERRDGRPARLRLSEATLDERPNHVHVLVALLVHEVQAHQAWDPWSWETPATHSSLDPDGNRVATRQAETRVASTPMGPRAPFQSGGARPVEPPRETHRLPILVTPVRVLHAPSAVKRSISGDLKRLRGPFSRGGAAAPGRPAGALTEPLGRQGRDERRRDAEPALEVAVVAERLRADQDH